MAANNELTELDKAVYHFIETNPGCTADEIQAHYKKMPERMLKQSVSDLISNNYIIGGAEQPLRYRAN